MKRNTKKIIALAISVVMIVGTFPLLALAEWKPDDEAEHTTVVVTDGDTPPPNSVASVDDLPESAEEGQEEIWVLVNTTTEDGDQIGEPKGGWAKDEHGNIKLVDSGKSIPIWVDKGGFETDENGDLVLVDSKIFGRVEEVDLGYEQVDGPAGSELVKKVADGNSADEGIKIGGSTEIADIFEQFSTEDFSSGIQVRWEAGSGNNAILFIPAGEIMTLRVQDPESSGGYLYYEIAGPYTIGLARRSGDLADSDISLDEINEIFDNSNDFWIVGTKEYKINGDSLGTTKKWVPKQVPVWKSEWVQQMIPIMVPEWDENANWVGTGEYEKIVTEIYQRFVWVPNNNGPGGPDGPGPGGPDGPGPGGPGGPGGGPEDGYFIEITTGEIFTPDEVLALVLPPGPEILMEITPQPLPMAAPAPAPAAEEAEEDEIIIAEPEVPLAPGVTPAWSLLDLLLTIATGLMMLTLFITYFTGRDKEEYENPGETANDEELRKTAKRKGIMRILSIIPLIASVIVFILTQDMRTPMIWIDNWTWLFALLAILQVVVMIISIKKRSNIDEDDNNEPKQYLYQ